MMCSSIDDYIQLSQSGLFEFYILIWHHLTLFNNLNQTVIKWKYNLKREPRLTVEFNIIEIKVVTS